VTWFGQSTPVLMAGAETAPESSVTKANAQATAVWDTGGARQDCANLERAERSVAARWSVLLPLDNLSEIPQV
jgi:hypothetical protein